MANKKLTDLPAISNINLNSIIYIVDSNTSYQGTFGQFYSGLLTGAFYPLGSNPSGYFNKSVVTGISSSGLNFLTGQVIISGNNGNSVYNSGQIIVISGAGIPSVSGGLSRILKTTPSGNLVLWPTETGISVSKGGNLILEGLQYLAWTPNVLAPTDDGSNWGAQVRYNYNHSVSPEWEFSCGGSIAFSAGQDNQKDSVIHIGSSGPRDEQVNIQHDGNATATDLVVPSKRFQWLTQFWSGSANRDGTIYSRGTGDINGNLQLLFKHAGAATSLKITNQGIIESTIGGFKFPDGTTQTSAATSVTNAISEVILTGDLTLGTTDTKIQFFTASGSNKTLTLPENISIAGKEFYIKNIGVSNNLIINNASGIYETSVPPSWFCRLIARTGFWDFETQSLNTSFTQRLSETLITGTGAYTILNIPSGLKYITQSISVLTTYVSGLATGAYFSLGDTSVQNKVINITQLNSTAGIDTFEKFNPKTNAGVISGGNSLIFTVNSGINIDSGNQRINVFSEGYYI